MAATLKSTIRGLINALQTALKDKSLPKATREHIDTLDNDLKKTWTDLETNPEDQADQGVDENTEQESAGMSMNQVQIVLQDALCKEYGANVYVQDLYDDSVIYRVYAPGKNGMDSGGASKLYQRPYVIGPGKPPTFGDAVEVQQMTVYCPVGEARRFKEVKNDPKVGGGVDRDKIPAEDFAGKNRSFPIVKPGDVSDAASSIGRAGADNYSTDQLKANIVKIAKRKGKEFMAELPKAWMDATKTESAVFGGDYIPLLESIEISEFTQLVEDSDA